MLKGLAGHPLSSEADIRDKRQRRRQIDLSLSATRRRAAAEKVLLSGTGVGGSRLPAAGVARSAGGNGGLVLPPPTTGHPPPPSANRSGRRAAGNTVPAAGAGRCISWLWATGPACHQIGGGCNRAPPPAKAAAAAAVTCKTPHS